MVTENGLQRGARGGDYAEALLGRTSAEQMANPLFRALWDGLLALSFEGMHSGMLDRIERVGAAIQGAVRAEQWRRAKVKTSRIPYRRSGLGLVAPLGTPDGNRASFVDHPYRYRGEGPEAQWDVAEPYGLGSDDIVALAELVHDGWDVWIDAGRAVHFPGHTVWVGVRRDKERNSGAFGGSNGIPSDGA